MGFVKGAIESNRLRPEFFLVFVVQRVTLFGIITSRGQLENAPEFLETIKLRLVCNASGIVDTVSTKSVHPRHHVESRFESINSLLFLTPPAVTQAETASNRFQSDEQQRLATRRATQPKHVPFTRQQDLSSRVIFVLGTQAATWRWTSPALSSVNISCSFGFR